MNERHFSDTEIRYASFDCDLGAALTAESARGLCWLSLGDAPDALAAELREAFPSARLIHDGGDLAARAMAILADPARGFTGPVDLGGTPFQRGVWRALTETRAGETLSYAELALRVGAPGSARAVAGACAANRIAVVVPCHRVTRADGAVSGYRWGVARKRRLLEMERAA